MKRYCLTAYPFFALIGFILSPLAVVHASPSTVDSVHFCLPFDYERWQRDHPLPAGKRLANLDVGEPRTVRMIYFLPNDRPYRQGVVDEMKTMMRRVQTFYADQMQAHGYDNTIFRFETDAQGDPLVHRVDGQHPESHYNDNETMGEVLDEIWFGEGPLQFDVLANDYLIVIDNSTGTIDVHGYKAGGVNSDFGKRGGITLVPSDFRFGTIAHELGHTFGLVHDFRDDSYIMSYGGNQDRLSACAAEFLSVHPYFNSDISLGGTTRLDDYGRFEGGDISERSSIRTISPMDYPTGSTSVSIQLKVSDAEGLHQVLLSDVTREPHSAAGLGGLVACRGLAGEKEAVVEFEYDVSIPPFRSDPSEPEVHYLFIWIVDTDGEGTKSSVTLVETSPYQIATLQHLDYVRSVSFSPDGTLLATAESEEDAERKHTVSLWDVASRQQVATLLQLEDWRISMSFSPDGTFLAIGGEEGGEVSLWDVASRQRVATFEHGGWEFRSMSFSPDGTFLAIALRHRERGVKVWGEVSLWDVASRQRVATFPLNNINLFYSISFSPDGTLLATAEAGADSREEKYTVSLWNVASRRQIATLQSGGGWHDFVGSVSFSPDGTLLATAGYDAVRLWDVASRQEVATFAHPGYVGSVSFSPDGALLATGGGQTVRLWDVASRQEVATFAHPGYVGSVSFSPDGALLATGGGQTVRLWDISEWTGEQPITTVEQAMPHTLTIVSGDEQEGTVGTALAKPFVVSVLDQEGAAFAGAVVRFSVAAGGGTLSSTTATTDANGRARSTLTLGSDPGTNTVTATVEGLEPETFTASGQATTDSDGDDEQADDEQAMPHTLTKVSGEGQAGPAGTTLAAPFVVSVLDQNGSAYAGAVVTFSVTAGGGTLSATTATTNANGRARSTLTLGSQPGPNTVSATVAGLESVAFTATATAIEQTPHTLTKVSGEGRAGPAGATLAEPFVVSVVDEDGAAIAGASVTFSVTAGGGTLSSATATTDANGRARSTLTLGNQPGLNTVTTTVAELESVTFTASGYAIPQSLTKVSGEGQEGPASTQLDEPFVVSVLDEDGAAIAGASVTFSVTAGGGTLSSTTATTDANGRARSTLTLGSQPGLNAVAATVAGLESVTFTASGYATPHSLTKVSGEGQEGPASTQLNEPFVVSVLDQGGAAIAGASVTFSVTAGEGVLSSTTDANPCIVGSSTSSTTATTDANGRAATRLALGSQPGSNTVAATVEGLEPVTFTATAAEQAMPHSLTKVCGEDQEGTAGILLDRSFVVSVLDEDGAAMAGVVVTFSVTAGGGTLSSTTSTTEANGRAATRLTLGSQPGTNTVEATVAGLESVTFTASGQASPVVGLFDLFGSGKRVALPDSPQLAQNAPNPFNSQTVLSYFLHAPGLARLEVFALTGQRVAVLHQGPQQAGSYRLHWDGRDDAGHPVASGAYLYRLVTDEVVLTRKLTLLR